jgi:hypothetical protein
VLLKYYRKKVVNQQKLIHLDKIINKDNEIGLLNNAVKPKKRKDTKIFLKIAGFITAKIIR